MLAPPFIGSRDAYSARLGDVDHWRPFALQALINSGLPEQASWRSGFEGTYPTLLGDHLVVKLFGWFPGWRESWMAERAANEIIATTGGIAAPRILAHGSLFPGQTDDWPFLVTERLGGVAWRDAQFDDGVAGSIARSIGDQIRRVHDLPTDGLELGREDWISRHGAEASDRHRRWGSLPSRLVDQITDYLYGYRSSRRCLVHGDLTEDHLFVDGGRWLGIIDWGDAMITDPFYELGALHLGAFAGDHRLLGQFLDGCRWRFDEDFADHALQAALMHEFDLFGPYVELAADCGTLSALAQRLWTPIR